jgi:alpha-galactosidase
MRATNLRGELRYRTPAGHAVLWFGEAGPEVVEDANVRLHVTRGQGRFDLTVQARAEVTVERIALEHRRRFLPADRFFLNGYQSWTDSREFGPEEAIPPFPPLLRPALARLFRLNRYGDYDFAERPGKNLHGFTYAYMRGEGADEIELIGSLSEGEGFTVFYFNPDEGRFVIEKDAAGLVLGRGAEWKAFRLHLGTGPEARVFSDYVERYLAENGLPLLAAPQRTGWTSWYYHYTNISEAIVLKNLDAFVRRGVPIDVFQIDDGWQGAVGDWLVVNEKFPRGMRSLVDRIHAAGMSAGLWLAPFVAEKKSRLVAEHPEWLLRDEGGRPLPAGNSALWSGDFYGLDIEHPGLRDYLTRVFDTVLRQWGFDLVKLDFLYGACLRPRPERTRGEVMTRAMTFLRELCGDKRILGCGVPLGPAFGRVDYCRIGPDVAHEWGNTMTRGTNLREGISTIVALENAIGRRQLDGIAFRNDPDVFILRPLSFEREKFDLTLSLQELRYGKRRPLDAREEGTLFLLNHVFGALVFTSDDLDEYDARTMALYLSAFPLRPKEDLAVRLVGRGPSFNATGGVYEIRFRIGALRYLVLANLSEEPARRSLEAPAFSVDEARKGRFHAAGEELLLPAHASICLLEEPGDEIALVGSEGHLFPGADIEQFAACGDAIMIRRAAKARGVGKVLLRIGAGREGIRVNGTHVAATRYAGREGLVVLDADALPAEGA